MIQKSDLELVVYKENSEDQIKHIFNLKKGENVIGKTEAYVDFAIKTDSTYVDDVHIKITIEDNDYTIEDLYSKHGVQKLVDNQTKINLKPGKQYDLGLGEEKVFYINNIKLIFRRKNPNTSIATASNEDKEKSNQKKVQNQTIQKEEFQVPARRKIKMNISNSSEDDIENVDNSDNSKNTMKFPIKDKSKIIQSQETNNNESTVSYTTVVNNQTYKKNFKSKFIDNSSIKPAQTLTRSSSRKMEQESQLNDKNPQLTNTSQLKKTSTQGSEVQIQEKDIDEFYNINTNNYNSYNNNNTSDNNNNNISNISNNQNSSGSKQRGGRSQSKGDNNRSMSNSKKETKRSNSITEEENQFQPLLGSVSKNQNLKSAKKQKKEESQDEYQKTENSSTINNNKNNSLPKTRRQQSNTSISDFVAEDMEESKSEDDQSKKKKRKSKKSEKKKIENEKLDNEKQVNKKSGNRKKKGKSQLKDDDDNSQDKHRKQEESEQNKQKPVVEPLLTRLLQKYIVSDSQKLFIQKLRSNMDSQKSQEVKSSSQMHNKEEKGEEPNNTNDSIKKQAKKKRQNVKKVSKKQEKITEKEEKKAQSMIFNAELETVKNKVNDEEELQVKSAIVDEKGSKKKLSKRKFKIIEENEVKTELNSNDKSTPNFKMTRSNSKLLQQQQPQQQQQSKIEELNKKSEEEEENEKPKKRGRQKKQKIDKVEEQIIEEVKENQEEKGESKLISTRKSQRKREQPQSDKIEKMEIEVQEVNENEEKMEKDQKSNQKGQKKKAKELEKKAPATIKLTKDDAKDETNPKVKPNRNLPQSKTRESKSLKTSRELLSLQTNFYSTDPKCLPKRNAFKVMFSNCKNQEMYSSELTRLGAKIVEDITQPFNVLIMDSFKRRVKVLVALNKKAWIVSSKWVEQCIEQNRLSDPDQFILEIEKNQEYFNQVNLRDTIYESISEEIHIFEGYQFYVPRDGGIYMIGQKELVQIIETGGGKILATSPTEFKENIIVVINEKNQEAYTKYVENNDNNLFIYSYELILMGCLTRKLELEKYILNKETQN